MRRRICFGRTVFPVLFLLVLLPSPGTAQKTDRTVTPADRSWEWFNEQGLNFLQMDQYDDAERMFRAALAETEKLGVEDERAATTYSNLGSVCQKLARYAEAEQHYQRAVEIYEKVLGSRHRKVAVALDNLASLYAAQKRYPDAESYGQRALGIMERAAGKNDPQVALIVEGLGELNMLQGRYGVAEMLYRRALDIRE